MGTSRQHADSQRHCFQLRVMGGAWRLRPAMCNCKSPSSWLLAYKAHVLPTELWRPFPTPSGALVWSWDVCSWGCVLQTVTLNVGSDRRSGRSHLPGCCRQGFQARRPQPCWKTHHACCQATSCHVMPCHAMNYHAMLELRPHPPGCWHVGLQET